MDRALGLVEWNTLFPTAYLNPWTAATSDHGPVLLHLSMRNVLLPEKLFRFEVMWETHNRWAEKVRSQWKVAQARPRLEETRTKLTNMFSDFTRWSKDSFGSVHREIKNLKVS